MMPDTPTTSPAGRYILSDASGDPAIIGTITGNAASGFRFISRIASRGNSTKRHTSVQTALPRWLRTGLYVRAAGDQQAVDLAMTHQAKSAGCDAQIEMGSVLQIRAGQILDLDD